VCYVDLIVASETYHILDPLVMAVCRYGFDIFVKVLLSRKRTHPQINVKSLAGQAVHFILEEDILGKIYTLKLPKIMSLLLVAEIL
jgi:hypothetical protein